MATDQREPSDTVTTASAAESGLPPAAGPFPIATTPVREPPSRALGCAIGFVIAAVAMTYAAIRFGPAAVTGWRGYLFLLVGGGIAEAINRQFRYRPLAPAATPVVADTPVAETPLAEPGYVPPSAGSPRVAGQLTPDRGRLVLTASEVSALAGRPADFGNVVTVSEPQPLGQAVGSEWRLVLARGQGVAVKYDGSQIWSFLPDGLGSGRLTSIDGRTQELNGLDSPPLLLWRSQSWDDYVALVASHAKTEQPLVAAVAWRWKTGDRIDEWLNFNLPFANLGDGVRQVMAESEHLTSLISAVGVGRVVTDLPLLIDDWGAEATPLRQALVAGLPKQITPFEWRPIQAAWPTLVASLTPDELASIHGRLVEGYRLLTRILLGMGVASLVVGGLMALWFWFSLPGSMRKGSSLSVLGVCGAIGAALLLTGGLVRGRAERLGRSSTEGAPAGQ